MRSSKSKRKTPSSTNAPPTSEDDGVPPAQNSQLSSSKSKKKQRRISANAQSALPTTMTMTTTDDTTGPSPEQVEAAITAAEQSLDLEWVNSEIRRRYEEALSSTSAASSVSEFLRKCIVIHPPGLHKPPLSLHITDIEAQLERFLPNLVGCSTDVIVTLMMNSFGQKQFVVIFPSEDDASRCLSFSGQEFVASLPEGSTAVTLKMQPGTEALAESFTSGTAIEARSLVVGNLSSCSADEELIVRLSAKSALPHLANIVYRKNEAPVVHLQFQSKLDVEQTEMSLLNGVSPFDDRVLDLKTLGNSKLRIRVSNLPHNLVDPTLLRQYFEEVGHVTHVYLPREENGIKNQGWALITFEDEKSALAALDYDGADIEGRHVKISIKTADREDTALKPKSSKPETFQLFSPASSSNNSKNNIKSTQDDVSEQQKETDMLYKVMQQYW